MSVTTEDLLGHLLAELEHVRSELRALRGAIGTEVAALRDDVLRAFGADGGDLGDDEDDEPTEIDFDRLGFALDRYGPDTDGPEGIAFDDD